MTVKRHCKIKNKQTVYNAYCSPHFKMHPTFIGVGMEMGFLCFAVNLLTLLRTYFDKTMLGESTGRATIYNSHGVPLPPSANTFE